MEKEKTKNSVTPVSNSPAFGRQIRRLREARGISMVELSRATGVGYASISAFELGGKGTISAEKAGILYDYLSSIPVVKTPLVTGPGRYPKKKRKHRKTSASVAMKTAATPVKETPVMATDPEPVPGPVPNPVPESNEVVIGNIYDLIREVNIRVFRECKHLIAEIDNKQTPDVVRTVDAQELVVLTNFLKENRGFM